MSIWILGQNSYKTVNRLKQLYVDILLKIFDPPEFQCLDSENHEQIFTPLPIDDMRESDKPLGKMETNFTFKTKTQIFQWKKYGTTEQKKKSNVQFKITVW